MQVANALIEPVQSDSAECRNEMIILLNALNDLSKGHSGVRLPTEWTGIPGRVADAFNDIVEMNERMASELAQLSRAVGKQGKITQRLSLGDVRGIWADSVQ